MNLKLLKAFVVLAEKGNYLQAALALSVTQPALTKQINLLESLLNTPLFTRGRQGSQLTMGGQRLLPEAMKVLKQTDSFLRHAEQIARGEEGRISIGFGLSSFYFSPECIARFRQLYPAIEVSLEDIPSTRQYDLLENGSLQVGFVRVPARAPLCYQALFKDQLTLVTPADQGFTVETWLRRMPLLRLYNERGRGLNAQTDMYLQSAQLFPSSTQEAGDIQTLLALVIAGIGVAILPHSIMHIAPASINQIPLTGRYVSWDVGIAWDDRYADLIRDNFIAMVGNTDAFIDNR